LELALCRRYGRAEPAPPRGGPPRVRWPSGENPGIMRGKVFSEGCGLRAREYGPDANPSASWSRTSWREAGGRRERAIRLALCRHYGRAEPAPPPGGRPEVSGLAGKGPGITRRAIFSEGRALRVRKYGPDGGRGIT
jgi:hypothetical protein